MEINTQYSNNTLLIEKAEKKTDCRESFALALEAYEEAHKLTANNIKKEDDWRAMSDKEWDKLLEHMDRYLDKAKEDLEKLKERQEEAARKMAAQAPAGMRAIFAGEAALHVAANGFMGTVPFATGDEAELEKLSWTYEMETEDQLILAKAKMDNERAVDMLEKAQDINLKEEMPVETGYFRERKHEEM